MQQDEKSICDEMKEKVRKAHRRGTRKKDTSALVVSFLLFEIEENQKKHR